VTTVVYFLVALAFPELTRRLPRSSTAISVLRIRYPDGRGVLRQLLQASTAGGFAIDEVSAETVGKQRSRDSETYPAAGEDHRVVEVTLSVHGKGSVNDLAASLSEIEEVDAVLVDDANAVDE
jgi:putative Mg2+ transporter-C (MgtC) family protein